MEGIFFGNNQNYYEFLNGCFLQPLLVIQTAFLLIDQSGTKPRMLDPIIDNCDNYICLQSIKPSYQLSHSHLAKLDFDHDM